MNTLQSKQTKTQKPLKTKTKVLITIWAICTIIALGFLGWIIHAAIVDSSTNHSNSPCVRIRPDGECMPSVDKPIIYLYPETTTEVSVTLGYPDKLTATYPEYNDGWHVIAEPSGNLTELSTNRQLYSLYWEGDQGKFEITDEGFIVKGSEVASFLEDKLPLLGLNARETEEFIIYWLPIMQQNEYNYVRFTTPAEIEEYMPLNIDPKPDTTIRVLMVTKPLERPIPLREQILSDASERHGFTVVEWGGTK